MRTKFLPRRYKVGKPSVPLGLGIVSLSMPREFVRGRNEGRNRIERQGKEQRMSKERNKLRSKERRKIDIFREMNKYGCK
jgi:hypothetical protein